MPLAAYKGFEIHGRATRKAAFLACMEMLVLWNCVLRADRTALLEGEEWTPIGGFGENASNVLGRQLVQLG